MSDNLPSVWDAEPHTRAKHAILGKYLQAWMAILSAQSKLVPQGSKFILYVDGFAGPGIYRGGEDGSPVVALRTAAEHKGHLPVPVRFLFIEQDPERFECLKKQVAGLRVSTRDSPNIAGADARQGDCATVLTSFIDHPGQLGGDFGPAMVFLDQFGYKDVPIALIAKIMAWPQCEVLSYLNWDHLNRFLSDQSKADSRTQAFGTDEWQRAIQMDPDDRRAFLLGLYKQALKDRGGARYVLDFAMYGSDDTLLYWLFFSTNHIRGLEEMKKAMWSVDQSGSFRFSDRDTQGQLLLLRDLDDKWLADELRRRLAGQTITVAKIKEFVLTETPCYLFKGALKILEDEKLIVAANSVPGRKRGTYPDECSDRLMLRFESSLI